MVDIKYIPHCNLVILRSVHLCQEILHSGCFKAALGLYSCTDTTELNCTCLDHVISDYVNDFSQYKKTGEQGHS